MLVNLVVALGIILLIDNIKENSPKNKRAIEEAKIRANEIVKKKMKEIDREVDELMKIREKYRR